MQKNLFDQLIDQERLQDKDIFESAKRLQQQQDALNPLPQQDDWLLTKSIGTELKKLQRLQKQQEKNPMNGTDLIGLNNLQLKARAEVRAEANMRNLTQAHDLGGQAIARNQQRGFMLSAQNMKARHQEAMQKQAEEAQRVQQAHHQQQVLKELKNLPQHEIDKLLRGGR